MDYFKKLTVKMKAGTKSKGKQTFERMDHADALVPHSFFLNRRQCEDLTTKLREIHDNIQSLVEGIKSPTEHLELALQDFYRCSEKAKMLVANCGERAWWCAALFQWRNENAFREILLELSLCYHVLYEEVSCQRGILPRLFETSPNDLRKSIKFEPASVDDVLKDEEDLLLLLEKLVTDHESIESEYRPTPMELLQAQSLANYLLLKMRWASEQSLASQMEKCRAIMWGMEGEHPRTWGAPSFIPGAGSSHVSGWRIEWLGMYCFKKEFHGEGDETFEKMFLKEAAIMAHLKHPNIIQFLCWGKGHESRFIGMELMEKNLLKLIEDQKGVPFSLEVTLDIVWQIARGMCYLHDQGIAHRDLKPQNVMVNKLTSQHCKGYWQVKVIDYGSSKTEVEIEKSIAITHFNIGTGVYRAPEVLNFKGLKSRGRAMWVKADVFSFAMTCAHVLTLHQPFENMGYSLDHLYDEVMNGKRPSLPNYCPAELSALMRNCWNIIPSKRPTFIDICSRLESLKHGMRRSTIETEKIQPSIDFIFKRIVAESSHFKSLPKVVFAEVIDEDESKPSDRVSIILCTCNKKLELLEKLPVLYEGGLVTCNMCGEGGIDGEVYHCSTCQFDAHRDCAEIREKCRVFYHTHPLRLLTQNYYKNNPHAKCSLCEESMQYSDWVYRCEECDYDVHARCTKFQNKKKWHNHIHPLTMRVCPPYKSLSCGCCDGEIQEHSWHYYCGPCAFSMHLCCTIRFINPLCAFKNSHPTSTNPLCAFENSHHRLHLVYTPRIFDCAFCHTQGYSQFFRCEHCEIDIHPDCMDYKNEEICNLDEVHEEVMMEKDNKDIHAQTILISLVLDSMSSFHASKGRPPSQRPRPVVKKLHAPIYETTTPNESHESLDLAHDTKLQRKLISTQTAKRIKAKKLALKKLQEDPLEMLENLEKIVSNLQSFESSSEDEKNDLMAVHKRLKEQQQLVKEEKAIQEESKLCPGPRIGVFFKTVKIDGTWVRELLIDLQASMKDVCFGLLCEKPGHEHIVPGNTRIYRKELGDELAENLKPLLACGLQIVRNIITSTEDNLAGLESFSTRNLEAHEIWNLSAINKIKGMEDMKVLKQAALSSSQWFLRRNEIWKNIKEAYGLHRICYKVTAEGSPPCYKNGSIAWLCKMHFDDGLKAGILESCSSKYHNIEDDYEIRYPPYLRED